jgi:hypothetical protein
MKVLVLRHVGKDLRQMTEGNGLIVKKAKVWLLLGLLAATLAASRLFATPPPFPPTPPPSTNALPPVISLL